MSKNMRRAIKELGVEEPGSSDEVVSQRKLLQFEQLEDELRALRKKFEEARLNMKDAFKSGASVSTGKRGVESGIRFRRHPKYKQALIDKLGEEYQQQVLNATEYRPYYYVRLITKNGKEE
jgi:hypothetical protein